MQTSIMAVVVTGASGFIGSYAAQCRYPWPTRLELATHRAGSRRTEFADSAPNAVREWTCDVTRSDEVRGLVAATMPDCIWHCAGLADERDPAALVRVNVEGTFILCEELHRLDYPCRLLFIGSAAEYGAAARPDRPVDEMTLPLPISLYGASKSAAWQIAQSYAGRSKLVPCSARLFNVIGDGQPPSSMASSVARQIAMIEREMQEPVLRVGNTGSQRDYIDINDAINACLQILERGRPGRVYNVCSGWPIATLEVIETLLGMATVPIRIGTGTASAPRHGIDVIWGDNSLIRADLGWQPQVPLIESLRSLLAWWRRQVAEASHG